MASSEAIRKAFRDLARRHHPDVSKEPDAEARFKQINEAYEVLSDSEKRSHYDQFGHGGPGSPFGVGFDDFGGIGDVFDAFFGGGRGQRGQAGQSGDDTRVVIDLEFLDAVFGTEKHISYRRLEPCGTCGGAGAAPGTRPTTCSGCKGSGQVQRAQRSIFGQFVNVATCDSCGGSGQVVESKCPDCTGNGLLRVEAERSVKIPAGLQDGTELRLSGEGDHGLRGGRPGDLYIAINVKAHEILERDGDNIVSNVLINVSEAALGTKVNVQTVDGMGAVSIPSGTQAGSAIRLRGKGVPKFRSSGRGDHYLFVHVRTPTKLSREQRRLMKELGETLPAGSDTDGRTFAEKVRSAFQ
ncbi:MAG TPA: molecular chaperone DnaJ [Chloroflexi bacterium]|nr:molecular chaperone DnaJ [Chloroflexota bacterium]